MSEAIPKIPDSLIAIDSKRRWVGYAALQQLLRCEAPLRKSCAVSLGHVRGSVRLENGIRLYDQRYQPIDDAAGHLFFALKHETLDLLVLKEIFVHLGSKNYYRHCPNAPAEAIGAKTLVSVRMADCRTTSPQ